MSEGLAEALAAAEREWLDDWHTGPRRTRWERIPLQPGDAAPDAELVDHSGSLRHLSSFWSDGPAVLLFWRHFGCSCGIDRAARLQHEYASFVDAGAAVVAIGMGEPERTGRYIDQVGLPCPMLCDPDRSTYAAYDLLEGSTAQVLFDAPEDFLRCEPEAGERLSEERHGTDRASVDSPWQMPGEFVVDGGGIIRLAYRYQYCEDWPDPRVLAAAVQLC